MDKDLVSSRSITQWKPSYQGLPPTKTKDGDKRGLDHINRYRPLSNKKCRPLVSFPYSDRDLLSPAPVKIRRMSRDMSCREVLFLNRSSFIVITVSTLRDKT